MTHLLQEFGSKLSTFKSKIGRVDSLDHLHYQPIARNHQQFKESRATVCLPFLLSFDIMRDANESFCCASLFLSLPFIEFWVMIHLSFTLPQEWYFNHL